jgi:Holliday junction DNA helicase RuvA
MIGYIEGKILSKEADRILVLANQIGYEVLLPGIVIERMQDKSIGDEVSLYIYYHQTERQPKPVLIGFSLQAEKEFFQYFITVGAIGPLKAIKALTSPVGEIATAIETRDIHRLSGLNGIGKRTAEKIVATLQGKMERFALIPRQRAAISHLEADFRRKVFDVLVTQMGHKSTEARRMIDEAMARNPSITSADTLIDEVYRGKRMI